MFVAQKQVNQTSPDTGRERLQSSADPARHVPAADLPLHALAYRKHERLAHAPAPNHLLHRGEQAPDGSIIRPTPQEERFVRSHSADPPEPDGSVKREETAVSRSKHALGTGVLDQRGKILILTPDAVRD